MAHFKLSSKAEGFTLIELTLAMALFSAVLVVATAGFIGMNRTYSRGIIKKELSQSIQSVTEDLTRSVRSSGATESNCDSMPNNLNGFTLGNVRYLWGSAGLFRDTATCSDPQSGDARRLLDDRYTVELLSTDTLADGLYKVQGVFRTTNAEAFTVSVRQGDGSSVNKPLDQAIASNDSYDKQTIACRGTAETAAVRTCAVENFSFIVNSRGEQQ
jgi:prepilin-type N-terminal cleavage/methylation domain-containing protein